jgi:hypothetical protein
MLRYIAFFSLLVVLACTLSGQSTTGEILGIVRDSSGAVIADAKVEVKNLETNATREVMTAQDGTFRVPLLSYGNYEVDVQKNGFAKYRHGPIMLQLNQAADLRIDKEINDNLARHYGFSGHAHGGWSLSSSPKAGPGFRNPGVGSQEVSIPRDTAIPAGLPSRRFARIAVAETGRKPTRLV